MTTVLWRGTIAALAVVGGIALGPAAHADTLAPYIHLDVGYGWSTDAGNGDFLGTSTGFAGGFGSSAFLGLGGGLKLPVSVGPVSFRVDLSFAQNNGMSATNSAGDPAMTGHIKAHSSTLLTTVYADYATGTPVTPFIGIGAGIARNRITSVNFDQQGVHAATESGQRVTQFAWTGTVGASYEVTQNLAVDMAYRYVNAGHIQGGSTYSTANGDVEDNALRGTLHMNEAVLSTRYTF